MYAILSCSIWSRYVGEDKDVGEFDGFAGRLIPRWKDALQSYALNEHCALRESRRRLNVWQRKSCAAVAAVGRPQNGEQRRIVGNRKELPLHSGISGRAKVACKCQD